MKLGDFTSFVIALLMLYEPVKRLTGIHNIFQQALGATQRVFEYLDRPEAIQERPAAIPLKRFEKAIVFERRRLPLPQCVQRLRARGHRPGSEGRRGGGAGGAERRGQDHAGQPAAALLRRDQRRRPDRRPRHAGPEDGLPAPQDQHRAAGDLPVQRHGGQQHPLRQRGRRHPGHPRSRPQRPLRGVHPRRCPTATTP